MDRAGESAVATERFFARKDQFTVYEITCVACPLVRQRFESHNDAARFLEAHNDLHRLAAALDDLLLRAEIRLARASNAWLSNREAFDKVREEYHAARDDVIRLRAQRLQMEVLNRGD